MKILRYLIAAVLVLGVSGIAHAFTFGGLDPQDPNPFPVTPGQPFTIQFYADCPSVLSGDPDNNDPNAGCFFLINNSTTQTITSLQVTFPDNGPGGTDGQNVYCIASTLFTESNCSLSNGVYTVDLYQGTGTGVTPGEQFVLIENCDANGDCVPPADFPEATVIANAPEPSSIWMGLSSLGSLGYLLRRRRRVLKS